MSVRVFRSTDPERAETLLFVFTEDDSDDDDIYILKPHALQLVEYEPGAVYPDEWVELHPSPTG